MTNKGFRKVFSGEETSVWVSRGGRSRRLPVGKLLSPIPQGWQQGPCTHARYPFLPQQVTVSEEEAGNVNKEHAWFYFDRYLSFVLLPCTPPHRCFVDAKLCGAAAARWVCSAWSSCSDQGRSVVARTAINYSLVGVAASHNLVIIYDCEGGGNLSGRLWQDR